MRLSVITAFAVAVITGASLCFTPQAFAGYEEYTLDRPYPSSHEYSDDYTESDAKQIKRSVRVGFFGSRSYNVYLPGGETQAGSYKRPAILLLHGAGRTGASLVERWRPIADRKDVILLGPHANGRWDPASDARNFIPALLKDVIATYNIDPSRIYVFGHSMGGIFASTLAITQPEGFAAIGIHAGLLPNKASMERLKSEGRKTPVIIINGTKDPGFPLNEVQKTADAFAKNGHDTEFHIIQDHGHWYYDIAYDINAIAWDFFDGKSL